MARTRAKASNRIRFRVRVYARARARAMVSVRFRVKFCARNRTRFSARLGLDLGLA